MSCLSRNDLDALGARIYSDYKHLPSLRSQQVQRVEPEILAQDLCRLNIDYCHLSQNRTVLGLTSTATVGVKVIDVEGNGLVYRLDGRTILIEKDLRDNEQQRGRYHFTLSHEVAHQILDRLYPELTRSVATRVHCSKQMDRQSYPITDWSEWQANALASSLLMPVELVFNALCRFDLSGGIKLLNRVFSPEIYERFCQAAALLGVSKQAFALRLKRLGMLNKDYLDDPYRLVDVEV